MKYFRSGQLLFLLLIVTLNSCSLSMVKRRYRPGYHVEVSKPAERDRIIQEKQSQVKNTTNQEEYVQVISDSSVNIPETIIEKVEEVNHLPTKTNPLEDSCDVVYMVTGERINAIVIEIGDDYVHYKKCDDLKGRLYTVKTKQIDNITLRNGEYFIPKDRVIIDKEKERRKSQTLFIMSIIALSIAFVSFIFSFFISPFSTISFIFSIIDIFFSFILMMINIRPSCYVPSYRTRLAWLFLALAMILIIAALVLVLI